MSESSRSTKRQQRNIDADDSGPMLCKQALSINYFVSSSLPSELFTLICSYLSVVTKMGKLSILNRFINHAFDPSIHCRNGTLLIDESTYDRINENVGSFDRVINVVSAVDMQCRSQIAHASSSSSTKPRTMDQSIMSASVLSSLVRALASGNVKRLRFTETVKRDVKHAKHMALANLMAIVRGNLSIRQANRLEELSISVRAMDRSWTLASPLTKNDFTKLMASRLQTIHLDIGCFGFASGSQSVIDLLSVLPSTVTYMKIEAALHGLDDIICQLLGDPRWLPHLRHMDFGTSIRTSPALRTVMSATGAQRPYEHLAVSLGDESFLLHPFDNIKQLFVTNYHEKGGLEQFMRFDASSMPKLMSFDFRLHWGEIECDINPLFVFLAERPIEVLSIFVSQDMLDSLPLSDASIEVLSSMHKLTSLNLRMMSRMVCNETVVRLIKPACWPRLTRLHLGQMSLTPNAYHAMLKGAPFLEDLLLMPHSVRVETEALEDLGLFGEITPMKQIKKLVATAQNNSRYFPVLTLLQACPLIKYAVLATAQWPTKPQSLDLAVFQSCVNASPLMPHLTELCLHWYYLPNMMLHVLVSKLANSPIRKFGPAAGRQKHNLNRSVPVTGFQLVMHRNLPHLVELWIGKDGINSSLLQGMSRKLADGTSFPVEEIKHKILRFRTVRDEHGRDGREAFFDFLYEKLTVQEKALLNEWDQGKYDCTSTTRVR